MEDPAVRIQLPFDHTTFDLLRQKGKSLGTSRGHNLYTIQQYKNLDALLGTQWHMRVVNICGDFSYVILPSVCFYLTRPRPLLDFNVSVRSTGELVPSPFYTEQQMALVFQFFSL